MNKKFTHYLILFMMDVFLITVDLKRISLLIEVIVNL